jgi:hypothetical protein
MKRCAHCGGENSDDASLCAACGNVLETPKLKAPKRPLFPRDHLVLRGLIALIMGFVISGISLRTAWRQSSDSFAWSDQVFTAYKLEAIGNAVIAFKQASNACPENFEQLQAIEKTLPTIQQYDFDISEGFIDDWKRPFIFSTVGTNCVILSYGRDGKPGGIGIDCDLTSLDPCPRKSIPTFGQFWANNRTRETIKWCFICGAMAAVLSLLTVRVPSLTKHGLNILTVSLIVTLVGTIFVASFITVLHIPSGH